LLAVAIVDVRSVFGKRNRGHCKQMVPLKMNLELGCHHVEEQNRALGQNQQSRMETS